MIRQWNLMHLVEHDFLQSQKRGQTWGKLVIVKGSAHFLKGVLDGSDLATLALGDLWTNHTYRSLAPRKIETLSFSQPIETQIQRVRANTSRRIKSSLRQSVLIV